MITDVAGIKVGHWTHLRARTGCTVVLFPPGTVGSAEVRGGAPATRELDLLAPERLVDQVDAAVLTGGSAFGLSVADGVTTWLADAGRGFPAPAGPVPIVPTLALYDLAVGDAKIRPAAKQGLAACREATDGRIPLGLFGAGTGCTVGKWRGPQAARPGGIGSASTRAGDLVVSALVAVNAAGDVVPIGATPGGSGDAPAVVASGPVQPFGNTTIGVIATNARIDKAGCFLVAQSGHDGMARAIFPAHTRSDGDALIAVATRQVDASLDQVRVLAAAAVEAAIRMVVTT